MSTRQKSRVGMMAVLLFTAWSLGGPPLTTAQPVKGEKRTDKGGTKFGSYRSLYCAGYFCK